MGRKKKNKGNNSNNSNNSGKLSRGKSQTYDLDDSSEEEHFFNLLPLESVVRVFADLTDPDYSAPWKMNESENVSGSGFAISGRRIMTNAHVVANATFVAVRKYGEADRIPARVIAISHECDIALLEVKDKSFWKDIHPVKFAKKVPQLQNEVFVVGYPEGGDTISVTKGIVSRIEPGAYTETLDLLQVQIDAAINAGNSGGPVFRKSQVVGIAFADMEDTDGIGYIIPTTVIEHFLEDIKRNDNRFDGFCSLGLEVQYLENKALRKFFKMPSGMTGLLVRKVDVASSAHGVIKDGDILYVINGTPVANDGTVKWRKHERIHYESLIQSSFKGDTVKVKVFRDGQKIDLSITLAPLKPLVVDTLDAEATYVSWAGLVFVPLSIPFVEVFEDELDVIPFETLKREWKDHQIVVLDRVLADEINYGYGEEEGQIVKKVNGEKVRNLRHLYELITSSQDEFIRIELDQEILLAFDRKDAEKATDIINRMHKIPSITNLDEEVVL